MNRRWLRHQFIAICWLGLLMLGCSTRDKFDLQVASARLAALLPRANDEIRLLMHRMPSKEQGSEFWVFATQTPPLPPTDVKATKPQEFPSSALFSFMASVGVLNDASPIPLEETGTSVEWYGDNASIHLRTVATDAGYLSVLERLP